VQGWRLYYFRILAKLQYSEEGKVGFYIIPEYLANSNTLNKESLDYIIFQNTWQIPIL